MGCFLKNIFKKSDVVVLPDSVSEEENLARNLIGGQSNKSIKRLYDIKTMKIKPSQFMDTRNPRELSVNRISTLDEKSAHQLGIDLKNDINDANKGKPERHYHGYGKLNVKECLDSGCADVEKEDYGGKKPYHANIIYPKGQKSKDLSIAVRLAFKAKLELYKD